MKRTLVALALAALALPVVGAPSHNATGRLLNSIERSSNDVVLPAQHKWTVDDRGRITSIQATPDRVMRFYYSPDVDLNPSAVDDGSGTWIGVAPLSGDAVVTAPDGSLIYNRPTPKCFVLAYHQKHATERVNEKDTCANEYADFLGQSTGMFNYAGGGGGVAPPKTPEERMRCESGCNTVLAWSMVGCSAFAADPPLVVICGVAETALWQYCVYRCRYY